jgi:prepilin-type N-terminal cleavage/methylation domain-containing protein
MKIRKTKKYNMVKFKRGFSVLEVMIALVILAITIIPSVNLFGTTVKYTINIHDIQVGMRLAQDAVENFSASSFAELRSVLNGNQDFGLLPESGQTAAITTQFEQGHRNLNHEFDKFKRKATLSKLEGSDDMLLIEVSVWWYDGDFSKSKPDQRFVTLSTIVHRDFVL